jgi:maleate isomerase
MYSWRARIGVVCPSAVSALMRDFFAVAPDGVSLAVTTFEATSFASYGTESFRDQVLRGIEFIGKRDVDCLVVAAEPFSNAQGPAAEAKLVQESEGRWGIPLIMAQSAAIEAMGSLGIKRVAVAAPYDELTCAGMSAYLSEQGLSACVRGLDRDINELHALHQGTTYRHIRDVVKEFSQADGIYIPCVEFQAPSASILEGDFERPVVSATEAIMWAACRRLQIRDPGFAAHGALLRSMCP